MKINKVNKGFTLPMTLMLTLALTLAVGAVGLHIVTDRQLTKNKKKRIDTTYAVKSAELLAQQIINDYSKDKLDAAVTTWVAGGANLGTPLLSSSQYPTFFDTLVTSPPYDNIMSNSTRTANNQIAKIEPTRYRICFFDDRNNNGIYDTGEPKPKYIGSPDDVVDGTLTARFTYGYTFTIYAYRGNSFNKNAIKKTSMKGSFVIGTDPDSFANFALFTNRHTTASGGQLNFAPGSVFDGPVHTNGANGSMFQFSGNPGTMFKDEVTSTNTNLKWSGGNAVTPALSDKNPKNGTTDVPTFQQGYKRGVPKIDLPANSFSQARAALGGDASETTALTAGDIATALGTANPAPSGIYVPNTGGVVKGGIYVKGTVDSLTMFVDGSNRQNYTFVQTVGGTTTRKNIVIDKASGNTLVQTLSNTSPYTAVTATTTLSGELKGIMHVEGTITSLGGPARTTATDPATAGAAIQTDNALTISATGDVIIQRDLKYQTDPRGADGSFGGTDDPNPQPKNTLGIMTTGSFSTSTGKVRIGTSTPKNVTIHGTVMATKSGVGEFTVDNYNDSTTPKLGYRGFANFLGGTITDCYGAFFTFSGQTVNTGFNRNFTFDKRAATNPPPFFPTTGIPLVDPPKNNIIAWDEVPVN